MYTFVLKRHPFDYFKVSTTTETFKRNSGQ